MKRIISTLALASGLVLTANANAGSEAFATGVYIAPGINYWDVRDIWNTGIGVDDHAGFNIGVGYQFNNPWALELMYQHNKTKISDMPAPDKMKLTYLHIDALYTFSWFKGSRWAPYAVAGVGQQRYASDMLRESDNTVNLGAGVKYAATPKLQFRLDGRGTAGTKYGDVGANINLGLVYVLGPIYEHYRSSIPVKEIPKSSHSEAELLGPPAEKPADSAVVAGAVIVDSDGDGVTDDQDQCANTSVGAKVDDKGCYIILSETRSFKLNVTFASGSSSINANSKGDIRDLANFLKEYPQTQVLIEGHSDNTGSAALNKRLSQARADAVKQSLIDEYGIDENRINSRGYGSEQPIADNKTAEGRALNRRVIAKVSAKVDSIQKK